MDFDLPARINRALLKWDRLSPDARAELIRDSAKAFLRIGWPMEGNRLDARDDGPFWDLVADEMDRMERRRASFRLIQGGLPSGFPASPATRRDWRRYPALRSAGSEHAPASSDAS